MASQAAQSLRSNWITATAGMCFLIAAVMAFLFVVRGSEPGSIAGINIWLLLGLGHLITGLFLMCGSALKWDRI